MNIFYLLNSHKKNWLIIFCLLVCAFVTNAQTNISVSACDSYVLPWNTVPTTTSGVYTRIYPKTPNPDSVVNITLTINPSPTNSILTSTPASSSISLIDEQFDILNPAVTYTPTGWFQTNKSSPAGTTNWFSGPFLSNGTPSFGPQSGNGCIVADYLNTNGNGTISNWLISPNVTMQNGDVLKFYTIQNPQTPYADRLEVRMSAAGASTNVGTTATSTGDFTTTILTINNTLVAYGYPQVWTLYTITISGLSAPTSGRIAFRYFVTSGGNLGANSDMIGIDNVTLKRGTIPNICAGNPVNLQVNTTGGLSPYNVVVSNSGVNSTHTAYTNGTNIIKNPTTATTYSLVSVTDANGCTASTKIGVASVNVLQPITMNNTASQCVQYALPWGVVVTTSGLYTNTFMRSNGCDSIVNYQVTIKNVNTTNLTVSACNQYILPWSATPVTASGTYSHLYLNALGCDSNVNIVVTIKLPITNNFSVSNCVNYLLPWGNTVTSSGTYSNTYLRSNGCDSIVNFAVTIKLPIATSQIINACGSYNLPWQITAVTASGTYTNSYIGQNGCDSVRTIILNIYQPITNSFAISACNSYTLPWQSGATTISGLYTHTYFTVNNCDSNVNINLTIYPSQITNLSDTSFAAITLPWGFVAAASGVYTHLYNSVNNCDSTVNVNVYIRPSLKLNLKVLLSGPFNPTNNLMNDTLRLLGLIPTTDPYATATYSANFSHVNNSIVDAIGANVLAVSGNNAIVDWVFVQLRSAQDSSIVIATKAALIQRDGDVVSANNGVSPIEFKNFLPGNYFISVKHRNHLGIMVKNTIPLSGIATNVDVTNTSVLLYQMVGKNGNPSPLTGATRLQNGYRTLYAGNVNISLIGLANKFITYNAWTNSDRATLLTATGGVSTLVGYTIFDIDMNGFARFNGLNPDRIVMFQNCNYSNLIIVNEQLP
jgi:hypothetical protein